MSWQPRQTRPNKPPVDPLVLFLVAIGVVVGVAAWRKGTITEGDLYFFAVLIPSIILHEVSHGWVANMWGDPTAKNAGRLTLNPLRHVDPLGTFILPALLLLANTGVAFGYAKPVPVNTSRMSRNKAMFVGLAGPAINIVIALLVALALHIYVPGAALDGRLLVIVVLLGQANVILAAFNLIPIPPLDGSSIIERFLPARHWASYLTFRKYSMFVLLFLVLFFNGALSYVFDPALDLWWNLLPDVVAYRLGRF